MAVEARHLNPFPPQIVMNRELGLNIVEGSGNVFGAQFGYGVGDPLSRTVTEMEFVAPAYGSSAITAVVNPVGTPAMKNYFVPTNVPIPRKRSREAIHSLLSSPFPGEVQNQNANQRGGGVFTFLDEDISLQIQQQQLEMDRFVAQHNEKVRVEIEDRRKRYCRRIAAALEENIIKKLKAKDEEIEKIGKLNWALEERVKSLCVENQIWRDLAQTSEATANALRSNLAQVLAQVQDEQPPRHRTDLINDAQSCCGSNFEATDQRRLSADATSGPATEIRDRDCAADINDGCIAPSNRGNRMCRSCEKEESCVLLLPCRHLCLCTVCGSTLHTCPVCSSTKTASVHVNFSS